MSKPFDATLKMMLEAGPSDWLVLAGLPPRPGVVIDADVSAVTAATDKVIRVDDDPPWLFDLNFQTGSDRSLPRRVHLYNTLLHERHGLPVRSTVILLTRDANLRSINGHYSHRFASEPPYLEFRYQVIRVWELLPEELLRGGLSLLPLAPISAVEPHDLPRILHRMNERLTEPGAKKYAPELWTASTILLGLQYDEAIVERLMSEVRGMAESVTIKIFERWGAIKQTKQVILQQGTTLFGEPTKKVREFIQNIQELPQLDELSLRVVKVKSWDELLEGIPKPKKPPRRKKLLG